MSKSNFENSEVVISRVAARMEEIDRDLVPVYIGEDRELADALTTVVYRLGRKPVARGGGRLWYFQEFFDYGIVIEEDDVGGDGYSRLVECICNDDNQAKLDGPYIYEDSSWMLSPRSFTRLIESDPLGEPAFTENSLKFTLDEMAEALEHATQLAPGQAFEFSVTALDPAGHRFICAILDDATKKVTFWPFLRSSFNVQLDEEIVQVGSDADSQNNRNETGDLAGGSKIAGRVSTIGKCAAEIFDDPLNIPFGGKTKLRTDLCARFPRQFTASTFDRAWKIAKQEKLVEVENVEQYKNPK